MVEALEFESEAGIFDAEAVEDGGLEIADVDGIFDDIVGEIVGFAVDDAAFDAAAGHPYGEAARMVSLPWE